MGLLPGWNVSFVLGGGTALSLRELLVFVFSVQLKSAVQKVGMSV